MRTISFLFAAGTQLSWRADRPCILRGVTTNSGNVIVSRNPAIAAADWSAPAVSQVREDVVAFVTSNGVFGRPWLSYAFAKGDVVYVTATAQSNVLLYIDG